MKVIELPIKNNWDDLLSPDHVKQIIGYMTDVRGAKINVDVNTIEKLWCAFSKQYDAAFLIPNEELICKFIRYIKNIDVDEADHMDYYGDITDEIHRSWDTDDEYEE